MFTGAFQHGGRTHMNMALSQFKEQNLLLLPVQRQCIGKSDSNGNLYIMIITDYYMINKFHQEFIILKAIVS